jgi:hypothetical protein
LVVAFAVKACQGKNLQVAHELTNCDGKRMGESQAGKGSSFSLPGLGSSAEADVLGDQQSTGLSGTSQ